MTTSKTRERRASSNLAVAKNANPVSHTSFFHLVQVCAPANAKWEPVRAQLLMTSLFPIPYPFKLIIRADHSKIQWFIAIPYKYRNTLIQHLYASYPQVWIDVASTTRALIGYYTYHYHTVNPFTNPILRAEDFSKIDPLTILLGAMTDLASDEVIVYELELLNIYEEQRQLGREIGLPSRSSSMSEKFHGPLKQVVLAAKIRANSPSRANELVASLGQGLAHFDYPESNRLVPAHASSFPLVLSPKEVAALWHLPNSEQNHVKGIAWASSLSTPTPIAIASKKQGVCLGNNIYQSRSQPIWLSYSDRITHVNIIGKTGTGKSTLMHHMIHQDIQAGKGVAVIDPHGDLVDEILATSIPSERAKDVILFDVNDLNYPIGLNIFSAPNNISKATASDMALAIIRKIFAESWSATRMEDTLYAALQALQAIENATIRDVARLLNDSAFRSSVLAKVTDPTVLEFWYEDYEHLNPNHQREIARPIVNRIRKFYRDPKIGRIISQDKCLDFSTIMSTNGIFLAKLAGITEIQAETLGALLISKYQLAAMSRTALSTENRNPYYLYIDEVQNLSATSLDVLFSEARKTGLNLVVANQFLGQLPRPILESIMGNVGTTIMFAIGPKDATTLAPFVKPRITSENLVNLDRFTAVVRMQHGGKTQPAFSIRTLSPFPSAESARERTEQIRNLSRRKYARHKDEIDAELLERYRKYRRQDQDNEDEDDYLG